MRLPWSVRISGAVVEREQPAASKQVSTNATLRRRMPAPKNHKWVRTQLTGGGVPRRRAQDVASGQLHHLTGLASAQGLHDRGVGVVGDEVDRAVGEQEVAAGGVQAPEMELVAR